MRKYKIGITFNLEAKVTDIWANGAIKMWFIFIIISTFRHCRWCSFGILGAREKNNASRWLYVEWSRLKVCLYYDVIDELDVLIEGTLSIEPELSNKMHEHGGKVVCYKMGPDYIMDIEKLHF